MFLFVTDGITDCQNEAGELFGEERLLDVLATEGPRRQSAVDPCDAITAQGRQFTGDREQFDDVTVVVARAV